MKLAPREREVLYWVVQGLTNKQIAQLLGITHSTVQTYVRDIMRVYNVNSRVLLVLAALKEVKQGQK
jgi:LuxR family maltose regulon positive regulatory protein